MPMIDLYIPEGALAAPAEAKLCQELTTILIRHEGLDPTDRRVRDVTWIFLHRPQIFRGGEKAAAPIYRVTPSVPEGQYTDEARASLVKDVTEAVARAEGKPLDEVSARVWVFPTEIFDGGWGSRGVIRRITDIMEYFGGAEFRRMGEQRLLAKRKRDLAILFEAAARIAAQN